ncbi:MAG: helix-turn-helix domain-containing protein [Lachnospiraceae bacterium]|jgi:IS30 family transposase|nr:helix-turn-helix domain-containing protein [Lachnospiraceae bacterium]
MGKTFKHMDLQQRLKLKEMLDSGCSILEVANALDVHRSAVYQEIERGGREGGYDPYYAQSLYEGRRKKKGRSECKLSNKDLANKEI